MAVNTEMYAMAAAAVYALEEGELTLWVDCQVVVSGFAKLETIAYDIRIIMQAYGVWSGRRLRKTAAG